MSQVSAPADKRFRRAHVKPGRKRRWASVARAATIYGFVAAGLFLTVYRGGEVVAHARVLQIDRLVVRGNERVPSATVLEAVDGLKGRNLVWTDLDEWRERLLQSPWVRDASLRRSLPSTVEISVSERMPTILARIDSRLYLVDEQGIVIDQYGPRYASFDLPIVDGLEIAEARARGTCRRGPGAAGRTRRGVTAWTPRAGQARVPNRRDECAQRAGDAGGRFGGAVPRRRPVPAAHRVVPAARRHAARLGAGYRLRGSAVRLARVRRPDRQGPTIGGGCGGPLAHRMRRRATAPGGKQNMMRPGRQRGA